MSRYIKVDALIDKLGKSFIDMDDFTFECPAEVNGMLDYAIDCVKEQPIAEVVEVVRCKDCEDYDSHDHRCKFFNHGIVENDYCSRAIERRRNVQESD